MLPFVSFGRLTAGSNGTNGRSCVSQRSSAPIRKAFNFLADDGSGKQQLLKLPLNGALPRVAEQERLPIRK